MSSIMQQPGEGPNKRLQASISPSGAESALKALITRLPPTDPTTAVVEQLVRDLVPLLKSGIPTLVPLLPAFLSLKGDPFTLRNHFPFEPFFSTAMPRNIVLKCSRQVSKSTSLAAQGVLISNCIPFFNTLYVTPLFEMIRRFSNNYVRGFIEQSPVAALWTSTATSSNVLQRSFTNHSSMFFSFAYLDADRTRGLNVDRIGIDETAYPFTQIRVMSNGRTTTKPILLTKPGDLVESFTHGGQIVWTRVVRQWQPSVRPCFKLRTRSGRWFAATSESRVATSNGWKRISQIVEEVAAGHLGTCPSDDARDAAGRRRHGIHDPEPDVLVEPQLEATQVQLSEVPGIVQVHWHAAQEDEERRLWEMVQLLPHTVATGVHLLQRPLLSQDEQALLERAEPIRQESYPILVGADQLGGDCVVDRGRRVTAGHQDLAVNDDAHRGLLQEGSLPASFLAPCEEEGALYGRRVEVSQDARQAAVHNQDQSGGYPAAVAEDSQVRAASDAVQVGDWSAGDHGRLRVLRAGVQAESLADKRPTKDSREEATLPPQGMHCSATQGSPGQVWRDTPGRNQPQELGEVLCRPRTTAGVPQAENSSLAREEPGQVQRSTEGKAGRSGQSQATERAHLQRLREDLSLHYFSKRQVLRTGVQTDSPQGIAEKVRRPDPILLGVREVDELNGVAVASLDSIIADEIIGIEYVGHWPVYDIETENGCFLANGLAVHNCQDMDEAHIPIIQETMSGSPYGGISQYTGTPKTLDNTIEGLWLASSMAEWVMTCRLCGYENVPAMSHDLDRMIGPWHEDISEANPGVICAKCRQPKSVFPREGRWRHGKTIQETKDGVSYLLEDFTGYHVPQIVMPMHYADPDKWSVLLTKRRTMPDHVFYNEVCGESFDAGSKLITLSDLQRAATLHQNTMDDAMAALPRYGDSFRILAIDWGGGGQNPQAGGQLFISYTVYAVLTILPDGKIHVIYGHRSKTPHDHHREAAIALHLASKFGCRLVCHDYSGAGQLREKIMVDAGYPVSNIMPMWYVPAASQAAMRYVEASEVHPRSHYKVDKARTLHLTCEAIRKGLIHFFKMDYVSKAEPGLLWDFLALVEDKIDSKSGRDLYRVIRSHSMTDDFAQAVNIGSCALWYLHQAWPQISGNTKFDLTDELANSPGFRPDDIDG